MLASTREEDVDDQATYTEANNLIGKFPGKRMPATNPTTWTIRFKGYLPVDDRMEERLQRICAEIQNLPGSAFHVNEEAKTITVDYGEVQGWLEESRRIIQTVRVGEAIVVKPPWEDYEPQPGDILLEVDPGSAFGSGLHESTRLCLRALERYVRPGNVAADFGTGSGILALAAAKLGASRVIAFDADPTAVEAARANVRRNGLTEIVEVRQADSPRHIGLQADLVTANITAEMIISYSEALARLLRGGGVLIAAGMTTTNAPEVERSLPHAGFDIVEKLIEGHWAALIATRQPY